MNDVQTLIGALGFPVVAYLLLYLDLRKLTKANTEAVVRLRETLTTLIDRLGKLAAVIVLALILAGCGTTRVTGLYETPSGHVVTVEGGATGGEVCYTTPDGQRVCIGIIRTVDEIPVLVLVPVVPVEPVDQEDASHGED